MRYSYAVALWWAAAFVTADEVDNDDDAERYWESPVVADPAGARCGAREFLDTIDLRCTPCASMGDAALVGDARTLDAHGNALGCRCPVGFEAASAAAACDVSGRCAAARCESCAARGFNTSYSDNSGCARCGPTTAGVGAGGDCRCAGAHSRLVERGPSLEKLEAKACVACATGTFVAAAGGSYGGVWYAGDPYRCRSCPDARMASRAGVGTGVARAPEKEGAAALGTRTRPARASARRRTSSRASAASAPRPASTRRSSARRLRRTPRASR